MYFSQFKGNFKQINELKNIINSPINKTTLIIGHLSSGKSCIHTMLQNENKYEILFVTDNNFCSQMIANFVKHRTINSFFNPRKKIVFIDDIDVINANKQVIGLISDLKHECTFVMTIKISEEKKFNNVWKKVIDHKIYLNQLNHKDCFQVMIEKYKDDDSIDHDKLIQLIKAQECNISNIIMLIDQARLDESDSEEITVQNANKDIFHHNIYTIVNDIYHKDLSPNMIESMSNKDTSIICPLIHENLVNVPLNLDKFIQIYSTLCDSDVIDKHVYINCLWNINWNMNNFVRFKVINDIMKNESIKQFDVAFTQQFTKLSSQMNIKKKIATMPNYMQFSNIIDVLHHMTLLKSQKKINLTEKSIQDLMQRFSKDYKI